MYAQKRVMNPQVLLEFLSYIIFAALMFYLVSTGKYQSYVTPRMVPCFYFTSAVMAVWAFGGLSRLFRPRNKIRTAHCFVLAIPIMLLLLPHSPITASDMSSGYLSRNVYTALQGQSSSKTPGGRSTPDDSNFYISSAAPAEDQSADNTDIDETAISSEDQSADNISNASATDTAVPDNSEAFSADTTVSDAQPDVSNDAQEGEYTAKLSGLDVKNKEIIVSNRDFGLWLSEILTDMDKYIGYKVVMTGFIFKNPEMMSKDEFMTARLMMSCCVADLAPAGLFCKYEKANGLKEDSWVTVEGTIYRGKIKIDDQEIDDPQISITKITPAREVDGYVYAY
jgi:putative membrane protein